MSWPLTVAATAPEPPQPARATSATNRRRETVRFMKGESLPAPPGNPRAGGPGAPYRALMDEAAAIRSGDFLLSVLGLAAMRDLIVASDQVPIRAAEIRHVVAHAEEFPFNLALDLDEHDVVTGYTEWSATYD